MAQQAPSPVAMTDVKEEDFVVEQVHASVF